MTDTDDTRATGAPDPDLATILPAPLAKKLARDLELHTLGELIESVPRAYRDRGQSDPATGISDGDPIGFSGTVFGVSDNYSRGQNPRVRTVFVTVATDAGERTAVFFNMVWVKHKIHTHDFIEVMGVAKIRQNKITVVNPTFRVASEGSGMTSDAAESPAGGEKRESSAKEILDVADDIVTERGETSLFERPILPVYPASKKTTTWDVMAAVAIALPELPKLPETLSQLDRKRFRLAPRDESHRALHFPQTYEQLAAAKRRVKFDVALSVHMRLGLRRLRMESGPAPASPATAEGVQERLLESLPYELTGGQSEVLEEISGDLAKEYPTARLLQGEVGSGKTVVSLLAMCQVVDAGRQCALLAPTEVLAAQHERALRRLLGELATPEGTYGGTLFANSSGPRAGGTSPISLALVTGSMSTSARREALLGLVTGEVDIVIGTHALFEESVQFFDLGLAVIDEQHRFGVEQRQALRSKRADGATPHVLTMTATPIPRTIAMMNFGDMSTSTLTELPAGRQPVETHVVQLGAMGEFQAHRWVERIFDRIHEEVAGGGRVFIVAPRIETAELNTEPGAFQYENGVLDGPARPGLGVEDLYDRLASNELSDLNVGLVHGRLPSEVKDMTMNAFGSGGLDVLVATTVIEVGVDVPDATMMVILDAERFGISQLHQLRGRIGRGDKPGVCLLVATVEEGSTAEARLEAVAETRDGFELAQRDLELRGEGDVFGDRQSGGKGLRRILSVVEDSDVIIEAGELSARILSEDPELEHYAQLGEEIDEFSEADYLDRT